MQETRMVKAINSWKPISKRPTGRPKIRWEDDVKKDIQCGAKRTHVFQIIVTLFIFNIKKIMSTPKQPIINAVLITYIDYSITENYIEKMA